MFKEFKEFAMKGNIMDLAIGVIIGGAFQKIVTSLVNDIIMPCISIFTGKIDYSNLFITVGDSKIAYGSFLTAVVDFLVVAFSLFLIIRYINKLNKKLEQAKIQELSRLNKLGNQFLEKNKIFKKKNKKENEKEIKKEEEPTTKICPYCYTEINILATRCPNCTSELVKPKKKKTPSENRNNKE